MAEVVAKLRLPAAVGGAGAVPGSSLSTFVNSLGTMQMTMHCCASLMSAAGFFASLMTSKAEDHESVYNVKLTTRLGFNLTVGYSRHKDP